MNRLIEAAATIILTIVVVITMVGTSLWSARLVDDHIDNTIAVTVKQATQQGRVNPAFTKLIKQMNELCAHTQECTP